MDAVIGAASEPGGLGACPRRADRMDLRKIARSRNWLNSGRQQASDGAPSDVQRPSDRPTGGAGLPRANLTGFAQFATSPVSMRDSIPSHDDPISVVDSIRLMPFLIVPVAETGDEIEHNQNPSGENSRRLRAGRTEFRASCVQCAGEIVFR